MVFFLLHILKTTFFFTLMGNFPCLFPMEFSMFVRLSLTAITRCTHMTDKWQMLSTSLLWASIIFILLFLFFLIHRVHHAIEHAVYFTFSFSFIVLRTLLVLLLAARIHSNSKETLTLLYELPSEKYDVEVITQGLFCLSRSRNNLIIIILSFTT